MRGGQHQVLLLMRGLRGAGHECMLLAANGSPLWNAAKSAGFKVSAANALTVWHESRRAAIVHAHDARSHTLAGIASRNDFLVSRRVAFPISRSVASRWKYRRAARYLAVSRCVAGELERAGIAKDRIEIVYDAVEAVRVIENWDATGPAVALAARDQQKGRDLVEAAASLTKLHVRFEDDLSTGLPGASMFVYITRSEGLGSAALLAMSMGVPVIASRVGGLTEIVEDGVTGLLVNNAPQEIASAMQRIVSDDCRTKAMIERARELVLARFTSEILVSATLRAYERVLAA